MNVKVYYQDFKLNSGCYDNKGLIIKSDESVLIREFTTKELDMITPKMVGELTKEDISGAIWEIMNYHPLEMVTAENKDVFKGVGHTSMSIGDYIVFDDGEIWIAANCGWEIKK